ncbi:sucrose synthase [Phtheirospermum japonicum]|uniref:sucrose synthase n=1 Tax=Phtheirospermum japonicum TaxID=374723 RepID=A0A830CKD7_9LAMI|nr:sucrose synthase [Phtheirospermum japonicum]
MANRALTCVHSIRERLDDTLSASSRGYIVVPIKVCEEQYRLAAEMLDLRKSQKLEMVKSLNMTKRDIVLKQRSENHPHFKIEELYLELRHKALELREEWRLENRKACCNILVDMEAIVLPPWVALAIRLRPGIWDYIRVNVNELVVEELTVPEYLKFKEELADGPSDDSFVLELDFEPFTTSFPKPTLTKWIGNGVEFLNRHLSAKMFHDRDSMSPLLNFIRTHHYKGKPLTIYWAVQLATRESLIPEISIELRIHYLGSSSDGAQLFYLGLTMGIAYSSLRHKSGIEKLTKSLKQSEDLVQDLHEELEMKDASTVKELDVEDYDPYFNDDAMQVLSPEQKVDTSPRHCNDEESLKKIEDEL